MTRCLVYRAAFAGDILMTSASLGGIRQKHPDIHLTYGLWRQYAKLVALNPYVDRVSHPGKFFVSDFDTVIDFRHEAFVDGYRQGPLPEGWYTRLVGMYPDVYWGRLHAFQCAEKGLLDLDRMKSFKPEMYISPADEMPEIEGRLVAINAWSQNGIGWRLWPHEKWVALVAELKKMGYSVIHLGSNQDPKIASCTFDYRGLTSLSQVASILARVEFFIGIDSFAAHCAHATKYVNDIKEGMITKIGGSTPTVLLAGPIYPNCVVPRDANCVSVSSYPDCDGPCGVSHPGTVVGPICEHKNSCMAAITVEQVMEAVNVIKEQT